MIEHRKTFSSKERYETSMGPQYVVELWEDIDRSELRYLHGANISINGRRAKCLGVESFCIYKLPKGMWIGLLVKFEDEGEDGRVV